jgi:hypothetical protein
LSKPEEGAIERDTVEKVEKRSGEPDN